MLHRIAAERPARRKPGEVSGVVLVPTRELAMQVAEAVHKYGKALGGSVLPLYGGAPMHQQVRALQRGVDVVVGTPGRVLDHIRRETLKLAGLQILVLDEADEMLDMGFSDDLDAIFAALPEARQTALFSATMPPRILQITKRHLKDPARVTIESEKAAKGDAAHVRQVAYVVQRAHKPAALARIIDMEDPVATLVFCRTRLEVESLVETFNAHGQRAEALHGGMEQRQRDKVMGLFRSQKADVLIATDVAARGLDISHITHVVNYDVPASAEVYLHRIGRTGRAGRGGTAITLVETREHRWLKSLERTSKAKIEIAQIPTVADLRAKQLDVTRASLREALLAGGHDGVRVVVESLAQEFDIVAIATTAVALLHAASAGGTDDHEIPTAPPPRFADTPRSRAGSSGPPSIARRRRRSAAAVRSRSRRAARLRRADGAAVDRRRAPGRRPPRRPGRRDQRRDRPQVGVHRRHRDRRSLLARRGARRGRRRRDRGARRDQAARAEGHGPARSRRRRRRTAGRWRRPARTGRSRPAATTTESRRLRSRHVHHSGVVTQPLRSRQPNALRSRQAAQVLPVRRRGL